MKRRYLPLIIGVAVLAAVLIIGFFVYRRLPGPPPAAERYEKPSEDLDVIDEPLQARPPEKSCSGQWILPCMMRRETKSGFPIISELRSW